MLVVVNGTERELITLDRPTVGLYVAPMVWAVQDRYTPDAMLLVLASHKYEEADYIREYDAYRAAIGR